MTYDGPCTKPEHHRWFNIACVEQCAICGTTRTTNIEDAMGNEPIRITITGHRPNKLGGYDPNNLFYRAVYAKLEAKILSAKEKFGNIVINTGMALGADQMAAQICVDHDIPFIAYTPCDGQEKPWPKAAQEKYRELLSHAQEVVQTHDGPYPGPWCLQRRNEVMVDNADYILSIYDGSSGGTANCITYAKEVGVIGPNNENWVNINPSKIVP